MEKPCRVLGPCFAHSNRAPNYVFRYADRSAPAISRRTHACHRRKCGVYLLIEYETAMICNRQEQAEVGY